MDGDRVVGTGTSDQVVPTGTIRLRGCPSWIPERVTGRRVADGSGSGRVEQTLELLLRRREGPPVDVGPPLRQCV